MSVQVDTVRASLCEKLGTADDQKAVVDEVVEQLFDAGYTFEHGAASFAAEVHRRTNGPTQRLFEAVRCRSLIDHAGIMQTNRAETEVTVTVMVGSRAFGPETGMKQSPIKAFDEALRCALEKSGRAITSQVVNFATRPIDIAIHGLEAPMEVVITFSNGVTSWQAMAIDVNFQEACWRAIVDGYYYQLLLDAGFSRIEIQEL